MLWQAEDMDAHDGVGQPVSEQVADTPPSTGLASGSGPAEPVSDLGIGAMPEYRRASGYGNQRNKPNWSVLIAVALLHALAFFGLIQLGYVSGAPIHVPVLKAVFMTEPEPAMSTPPPEKLVEPDEKIKPSTQIVAPKPLVQIARTNLVAASSVPPETVVVIVAPAASAKLVPEAPAAPIIAPNFLAGQLGNPGPTYPYLSRKAHEEGKVVLRVLVGINGRAKSIRVDRSSGYSRLDRAALATVRKWRFIPARQAGKLVEAWVLVPVTFDLN